MQITSALLRKFAGAKAPQATIDAIAKTAPVVLKKYGITTPLRLAHFFAQLAHESGAFTIREENLRYSAKRIAQVWPTRPAAVKLANNPEGLANSVYANRMGNGGPSSGDGYRYRGRGLAQHTGKDGYAAIERITNLPLVDNPELVNDPRYLLECAAAFWQWKKLAPLADRDDIVGVTKRWNGGQIGIADRRAWLAKAKKLFTAPIDDIGQTEVVAKPASDALTDAELKKLKARLRDLNYVMVGFIDDGWGPRNASALTAFCRINVNVPYADPPTRATYDAVMSDDAIPMPIAPERRDAAPEKVEETAPEAKAVKTAGFWGNVKDAIGAALLAVGGVVGYFKDAAETIGPLGLTGIGLGLGVAVIAYFYWRNANAKAGTEITKAVQTGARMQGAGQ